jgi:hypothetical protein
MTNDKLPEEYKERFLHSLTVHYRIPGAFEKHVKQAMKYGTRAVLVAMLIEEVGEDAYNAGAEQHNWIRE